METVPMNLLSRAMKTLPFLKSRFLTIKDIETLI